MFENERSLLIRDRILPQIWLFGACFLVAELSTSRTQFVHFCELFLPLLRRFVVGFEARHRVHREWISTSFMDFVSVCRYLYTACQVTPSQPYFAQFCVVFTYQGGTTHFGHLLVLVSISPEGGCLCGHHVRRFVRCCAWMAQMRVSFPLSHHNNQPPFVLVLRQLSSLPFDWLRPELRILLFGNSQFSAIVLIYWIEFHSVRITSLAHQNPAFSMNKAIFLL